MSRHFYSNPGKQTTSLVNGLFLADSVCAAMHTEFNSVMWWDMRNGQDTCRPRHNRRRDASGTVYSYGIPQDDVVAAGSSQYIHCVVTAASAPSETSRGFLVTAISAADTTKRDAVKASVSVK